MLKIEHLTKTYGDKKAVENLSLHIEKGCIYGFIGHNGAGKTTTIKAVCGILQYDEGNILIDGISMKQSPLECKQKMAYIPDNPNLYEFMSGIRYLNFIADVYGVGREEREERIARYAALFSLTDDLAQPISAYSHGMKQKLAIIAALIHEPSLVIMDEPFAGMDENTMDITIQWILAHTDGRTLLISTHDAGIASRMNARLISHNVHNDKGQESDR